MQSWAQMLWSYWVWRSVLPLEKYERDRARGRFHRKIRTSQGLLLSILCGLLASFMNFGVAFGTPLAQVARSFGANDI